MTFDSFKIPPPSLQVHFSCEFMVAAPPGIVSLLPEKGLPKDNPTIAVTTGLSPAIALPTTEEGDSSIFFLKAITDFAFKSLLPLAQHTCYT